MVTFGAAVIAWRLIPFSTPGHKPVAVFGAGALGEGQCI